MENPFKSFFHLKPQRSICPVCKTTLMEGLEVPVVRHIGCMTEQELVCSAQCKRDFQLRSQREAGL